MPLTLENDLAHKIIGFSIDIHKTLGPGLDPAIYSSCLKRELENNGYSFTEDLSTDVEFKDLVFENALQADLLVEGCVAILVDKAENLSETRVQNLLKILRDHQLKLGLIINFNAALLKNGIRRVTNHKLVGELTDGYEAHSEARD